MAHRGAKIQSGATETNGGLADKIRDVRLARHHCRRFYLWQCADRRSGDRGARLAPQSAPTVLVAHDTRFFSEEFARAAAVELDEHGVKPLLCKGAAPTPAVACEIRRRKIDRAINFTASHNPAEYHGLKLSAADGGPAHPEVTRDIAARPAKLGAPPAQKASAFPSPHE